MNRFIRFISVLMIAVFLFAAVSCTKPGEKNPNETKDKGGDSTGSYVADYLPNLTYDGKKFRCGVFGDGVVDIAYEDIHSVVDEALYKRNDIIENRYDVDIVDVVVTSGSYDDAFYAFQDNYLSSSDVYETSRNIMRNAWLAAVAGYMVPFSQLTYCHLDQPWYIKYVNDELSIGGTTFFAYTYESDTLYRGLGCILFNDDIYADLRSANPETIPDLYDLVDNDGWTLEAFYSLAEKAMNDVNGDSKFNIEDDVYGIITEDDNWIPAMWVGSGVKMIEKDRDGIPYFSSVANEKFIDILNDTYDKYWSDGLVFEGFSMLGQVTQTMFDDNKFFAENHSLFYPTGIWLSEYLTDMSSDFGVLPLPMYDEKQGVYYSRSCDGHAQCVPIANTDLDFTSVILEAMAVESLNYCVPAYFDNAIENRYLRHADKDKPIVSMIQANATIDLGDSIWMSCARNIILTDCFRSGNKSFAAVLEKYSTVIDSIISDDIEKLSLIIESYS